MEKIGSLRKMELRGSRSEMTEDGNHRSWRSIVNQNDDDDVEIDHCNRNDFCLLR
jgi:hypothetical protein